MKRILLLLGVLAGPGQALALSADDANATFIAALRAYEAARYDEATRLFNAVLEQQPDCARCAHLLGRSYGRLAEKAHGLNALGLARKTRDALELAVRLDPDDPDAIGDLIKYYRKAPGFLGGSLEKARALEERLRDADDAQDTESSS